MQRDVITGSQHHDSPRRATGLAPRLSTDPHFLADRRRSGGGHGGRVDGDRTKSAGFGKTLSLRMRLRGVQ